MSTSPNGTHVSRTRSILRLLMALLYLLVASRVAHHGAAGLVRERWIPLVEQAMLVFLLLLGYAGMGMVLDGQVNPIRTQGLPFRKGWVGESGLGVAVGWSIALLAVIPLAVAGGIAIHLDLSLSSLEWFFVEAAFFALVTLVEEIVLRGYAFQRLIDAVGPIFASIFFAGFYAMHQGALSGASRSSIAVSTVLCLLLSMAYLRTRALWVGWGLNFGWQASRALIFGLAVCGVTSHSPVVEGDPMGPFWLTGGGFGLDASWFVFALLLIALPVVYRLTRDLDFLYNAPVLIPSGVAVDLSAAGQKQHEAAMGPAAAAPADGLVQIAPVATAAPLPSNDLPS